MKISCICQVRKKGKDTRSFLLIFTFSDHIADQKLHLHAKTRHLSLLLNLLPNHHLLEIQSSLLSPFISIYLSTQSR